MNVTIIGGAGGMGKWFARFFKENGAEVQIVDKSDKTEAIAKGLGVQFLTTDVLTLVEGAIRGDIVDTDVLLVSVPIDKTVRVIERVGPEMHKGSLLMDITSVKKAPVAMMEQCTDSGVEILGTHPLFGPSTESMHGQIIIFVPLRKGHWYEEITDMFKRNGARIEFVTAEVHDEIMSVILGLKHFILLSFGITLKYLDFDVGKWRKLMNPESEIVMDFVGRHLHQDERLYAAIQTNFEMEKAHAAFLAAANRLYELVSAGNVDELEEEMKNAKKHFGDTERAMIDSERLIEEKINLSLKKVLSNFKGGERT
jgi:prephenate dehydrogenase